jgi:hypothetical protein
MEQSDSQRFAYLTLFISAALQFSAMLPTSFSRIPRVHFLTLSNILRATGEGSWPM